MSGDSLIGKRFGPYELQDFLGRGSVSVVFRAFDTNGKRTVTIKIFPPAFMENPVFMDRFESEARTVARLEHYNIVPLYDVGHLRGRPYLVTRYLKGGSLDGLFKRFGTLARHEALPFIRQIADALDYAHSQNTLHRALSPSNILFDDERNAYVSDFSIPIIGESIATLTGSGVIGSPAYIAPEVATGERNLTPAVDIYALGIITYQMFTGQVPFQAEAPIQQIMMHVTASPAPPGDLSPAITPSLERAMLQCLAKKPSDRFATAGAFASALEAATSDHQPGTEPLLTEDAPAKQPPEPPEQLAHTTLALDLDALREGLDPTDEELMPPAQAPDRPPAPGPENAGPSARQRRKAEREREREARRANRRGVPWYSVLMILLILIIAWLAVGVLVGFEYTRQANVAELNAINATHTQSAVFSTATSDSLATLDSIVIATNTAQALAATETAVSAPPTETPIPTFIPTDTPAPTPTLLAGSSGKIAFVHEPVGLDPEIVILDLSTEERIQVTDNNELDAAPAWSPDGSMLAYHAAVPVGTHIIVTDSNGQNPRELTEGIRTDTNPIWSPDGNRLAFYWDDGQRGYLQSITLAGEEETLTQLPRAEIRPVHWSPDGRFLTYFGRSEEDSLELLELDIQTEERGARTLLRGAIESADFSPDGQTIVYSVLLLATQRRQIFTADANCIELITLETCTLERLTNDFFNYYQPRFSPDGSMLLLGSDRSANLDLWLMTLDGEFIRQLSTGEDLEYDAVWQP